MKNYWILSAIILFLASSCSDSCKITVNLPDGANDGKKVYLQELSFDGNVVTNLDSTTVSDNTFKFTVGADSTCVRFLTIADVVGDLTNNVLVFIERGDVKVNMDTLNIVSGTPLNERYREFLREDNLLDMKKNNYYQILEDKSRLRYEFVKEIIDKPAGEFFFVSSLPILEPSQIVDLIKHSRTQFQNREEVKQIRKQAEYLILNESGGQM